MKWLMVFAATLTVLGSPSIAFAQAPDGARLYRENCASCHDAGADRAPSRDALRAMSPESVLGVMETGAMVTMASRNSTDERRAIAEFVTGKSFAQALSLRPAPSAMCAGAPGAFNPSSVRRGTAGAWMPATPAFRPHRLRGSRPLT